MNLVKALLHLEGAAIFGAATWAYFAQLEGSWLIYAALLLVPDVAMVGYLRDTRWGAWTYDLVHNEALVVLLLVGGLASGRAEVTGVALILGAHVGMDRGLGFGLKFPTHFKDTHLQRLGTPSTGASLD